jgi:hypothetical protein
MSPVEPGGSGGSEPGQPSPRLSAEEALRRLEDRLDRASDAAERLIAEAAAEAARRARRHEPSGAEARADAAPDGEPPTAGWQLPEDPVTAGGDVIVQVIHALRELIPPELQRRLAEALREVLLAIRALIDWYLERLERRRAEHVQVQDIPIT